MNTKKIKTNKGVMFVSGFVVLFGILCILQITVIPHTFSLIFISMFGLFSIVCGIVGIISGYKGKDFTETSHLINDTLLMLFIGTFVLLMSIEIIMLIINMFKNLL